VRVLATMTDSRLKRWPQIPTLKDAGHDIVVTSPIGIVGPKGMEARVVRRLHDAFLKATSDPAYLRSMEQFDQVPEYLGSEDYARAAAREVPREKAFVQELGITLD
jgi:tripartite-type tricarboxylate transporter receptor subunit TctC